MNNFSIFLNGVTVVDHAYINKRGMVVGGSFNPTFLVSGKADPVEKVVVDFSTIKKTIKKLLDDRNVGFDHKLWILENYSNCERIIKNDRIIILTPYIQLNLPLNAVKIVEAQKYSCVNISRTFEKFLNNEIIEDHPGVNIRCYNSVNYHQLCFSRSPVSYFSYCHGLKNSTSWGCQNNSHGHLSFISMTNSVVNKKSIGDKKCWQLQREIAKQLNGIIFIWKDNLLKKNNDSIEIEYSTEDRGYFYGKYNIQSIKLALLDTETTIEFLLQYVYKQWKEQLDYIGVKQIALSEGLAKGAYLNCDGFE